MSYRSKYLPKVAPMTAAIAITFCIQGLLLAGFDHMARESRTSTDAGQLASTPIPAIVAPVQS